MTKTISFHFIFEGKWLMNTIRQLYWWDLDHKRALDWFSNVKPKLEDHMIKDLLNGDAEIAGWTICKTKGCHQCKGKKQLTIRSKNCVTFKKKLAPRKLWVQKNMYEFGSGISLFISKSTVDYWKNALLESKEFKFLRRSKVLIAGWKAKGSQYVSKQKLEDVSYDLDFAIKRIYDHFELDHDEEYLIASPKGMLKIEVDAFLDNEKTKIIDEYKQYIKDHRKSLRESNAQDIEGSFGMRLLNERSTL